jgi:hypothetical protein
VLYPLFEWMEGLGVYSSSQYIGPAVNLVHLLSMIAFMGALLLVDLRMLGLGLANRPLSEVARGAWPWLVAGLVGVTVTGIPQLAERATDQYLNSTFWVKMWLLVFGVIWIFSIRRRVSRRDDARGALPKLVAIVSIVVWAGVASTARLIMLLPDNFFFAIEPPAALLFFL